MIKSILKQLVTILFPSFGKEDIFKNVDKRTLFYSGFLKENDLVFDVGANIGNRTVVFEKLGTKVVAIEPQIECVKELKKQFGTKIFYENIGLAEKEGVLDFYISNEHTLSTFSTSFIEKTKESGRFAEFSWDKKIQVPVKTLDIIIQKYGIPKFIKIDSEGYELNIVKGLSIRIEYLSLEYALPELRENLQEIIYYLLTFGQIFINFSVGESMEMYLDTWIDGNEFVEHINNDDSLYKAMGEFGDIYVNMKL
jgi:FkbM family methyltransferase